MRAGFMNSRLVIDAIQRLPKSRTAMMRYFGMNPKKLNNFYEGDGISFENAENVINKLRELEADIAASRWRIKKELERSRGVTHAA